MSNRTTEQLAAQKRVATDKKRFVKLTYGRESCVCLPDEAEYMLDGEEDPSQFRREDVWMTEAEYEALPEFGGW